VPFVDGHAATRLRLAAHPDSADLGVNEVSAMNTHSFGIKEDGRNDLDFDIASRTGS